MNRPSPATSTTAASSVKSAARGRGASKKASETMARITLAKLPESQTARSARAGSFAPRLWPTSVAVAFENPHTGSKVKITSRIVTV